MFLNRLNANDFELICRCMRIELHNTQTPLCHLHHIDLSERPRFKKVKVVERLFPLLRNHTISNSMTEQ